MTAAAIDRTGCTSHLHGNDSAYRQGCRCEDAREDKRIYLKRRREGRHTPKLVDGAGTARRLQALGAIGWPSTELGARLGVNRVAVQQWRGGRRQVTTRTATRVAQLYDQLSGTGGPSAYTRTRARSFGWSPPLLWGDADIDDPAAKPVEDKPVRAPRVDLAEVEHLRGGGLPLDEIAQRLGVKVESIDRAEQRARQHAAAQPERTAEAIATYWAAVADGHTPAQATEAAEQEQQLAAHEHDWAHRRDTSNEQERVDA